MPGPEFDLLSRQSREALVDERFRVAAQSDRMGIRLEGVPLSLASPLEMISEGVATGTLQLPPEGLPILLLADRQTVGGYPRIATVASIDIPIAAQLRPGDTIRFELIPLETGQQLYLRQQQELTRLKRSISLMAHQHC
jgi:antagonist of KipI